MKTKVSNGVAGKTYSGQGKFISFEMALLAAQSFATVKALKGYLTCTTAKKSLSNVEVSIYFDGMSIPKDEINIPYTRKEIMSHEYYSDYEKAVRRVRTITYYFESEKK